MLMRTTPPSDFRHASYLSLKLWSFKTELRWNSTKSFKATEKCSNAEITCNAKLEASLVSHIRRKALSISTLI